MIRGDSVDSHFEDTINSGQGLSDENLVKLLVNNAPNLFRKLSDLDLQFDRDGDKYVSYLGGGHSHSRMVYTKNKNGPDITKPLFRQLEHRNIKLIGNTFTRQIIKKDDIFLISCVDTKSKEALNITAKTVIIATGGGAQIYEVTRSPLEATGDGFVLAYNLGAELIDMEFVQHYPLEVLWPKSEELHADVPASLPSLGAITRNINNEAFMKKYDTNGDLATRDIHSRGIFKEIIEGRGVKGGVWLDLSEIEDDILKNSTPDYYQYFISNNIPKSNRRIIVSPGAHYFMGGVRINENGMSSVPGLFACGEVVGGIHGANRLACNSLPDCLVFGDIAGSSAAEYSKGLKVNQNSKKKLVENFSHSSNKECAQINKLSEIRLKLKKIMWNNVGLLRSDEGLKEARKFIDDSFIILNLHCTDCNDQMFIETQNMLILSNLICSSSIKRKESRGSFFRTDCSNIEERPYHSVVIKMDDKLVLKHEIINSSFKNNITENIYKIFTARKYSRGAISVYELKEVIKKAVDGGQPIKLVGFWGASAKDRADLFDKKTCDFLNEINERVRKIYKPGLDFTFILADMHSLQNGYRKETIQSYYESIKNIFSVYNYNFVYLSDLWNRHQITSEKVNSILFQIPSDSKILPDLDIFIKSAAKRNIVDLPSIAAKKYIIMRNLEKVIFEKDFLGYIFNTFSDIKTKSVLPDGPILFLYSSKGRSRVPWFEK